MTGTWRRRFRESGLCVLLLLLLPLGFHLVPWMDGTVYQDAAAIQSLPPWTGDGTSPSAEAAPLSVWQMQITWPAYQFINEHGHDPRALQWNPDIGLGIPFVANPSNRCFSPFSFFFYLFPFGVALVSSLIAKAVAAGWVAFYVARRYGFTPWYGFVVALLFQWCGPMVIWGMEPLGDGLVWFPLLVLATDRLILGQFRAWPGVALVIGVMAISGGVHFLAAVLVVMALYMILRRFRDHRRAHVKGALPGYALGVVAGLGLAAVQLAPFVELLQAGNAIDHTYPWTFEGNLLLGLFGPAYYTAVTGENNPLVHMVFLGPIPLLFIGLWVSLRRLIDRPIRHRVECLLLATLVVAAVPAVLQEILPQTKVLRLLHPAHYLAALSFPLALMVAGAVESWLHLNADQCKRALVRMAIILPVYWGGLLAAFLFFARDSAGAFSVPSETFWVFTVSVFAVGLLFGGTLLYPQPRVLIAGTLVLVVGTTVWGTLAWLPRAPRDALFPETAVIATLQRADARVGGTDRMAGWPLSAHRIPALYAPSNVVLSRTQSFLARVAEQPLLQRRAAVGALLLQKDDVRGPYAPVRADLNIMDVFDSGLVLFRDKGALPRYRIAHDVEPSEAAAAALSLGMPPVVPGVVLPELSGTIEDDIQLADVPRNHALDLAVEMSHPGVLIVAEAWYPGWSARVDGNRVPILPVDGAMRGIELGAGSHEVSFRYRSASFRWGALLSCISLVVFLFGAIVARSAARRTY